MSAFLILLSLQAIAWGIVGFGVATFCLRLRWNLVGGVLLISLGYCLPMAVGQIALALSGNHARMRLLDAIWVIGMIEFSYEVMLLASCAGFLLGALVGTTAGLWPTRDNEGNRCRGALQWTPWKLVVAGPVALLMAWTLFFLADVRAKSRLAEIRTKHQAILDVQEDVAPRLQNDAAMVHDALMLAIMEDQQPDWVLAGYRQRAAERKQHVAVSFYDYELLNLLAANYREAQTGRDFVTRHEEPFLKLRRSVLDDGLEYRHWDVQVARFAALHAIVQVEQNDLDSALQDLKLLRIMAMQSIDKRIEDSFVFVEMEDYRKLVFQAVLATQSPVPPAFYEEILKDIGDFGPSFRRGLKRQLSKKTVEMIDRLLNEGSQAEFRFQSWFQQAAERIIYQEHIPRSLPRIENQINQAFLPSADPIRANLQASFPSMWDLNEAWMIRSGFSSYAYSAFDYRARYYTREELIKAVRVLEQQRDEKGRFLTQQEFLSATTSQDFNPAASILYVTLHDMESGQAEGAVVYGKKHHLVSDGLGFYLGKSILPIIQSTAPTYRVRPQSSMTAWELKHVKNNPLRLYIPHPKASTTDPGQSMD
ncbi:hypothetical protein ACYFX5_15490 [Bremerella sp. T1]|uniref:hypothetical protein n=1 Tax=Bremerella sp. TYQ1 TaxID=3119568 RepID=UPI001CCAFFBF|nr:hypothetical protein [Bremerella volcania]UBM34460.1 hypothetical protein LA756_17440 [Bremerella volcania]